MTEQRILITKDQRGVLAIKRGVRDVVVCGETFPLEMAWIEIGATSANGPPEVQNEEILRALRWAAWLMRDCSPSQLEHMFAEGVDVDLSTDPLEQIPFALRRAVMADTSPTRRHIDGKEPLL